MLVGSWARLRRVYGETRVSEDGGAEEMSLSEWCSARVGTKGEGVLRVCELRRTD